MKNLREAKTCANCRFSEIDYDSSRNGGVGYFCNETSALLKYENNINIIPVSEYTICDDWERDGLEDKMSELKACPFCGSKDVEVRNTDDGWYYVTCTNCGSDGQTDLGKSGAIEVWNTRIIQWVPVDKRLPMDENEHHVMADEELFVCKCIDETWWIWDDGIGYFRIFLDNVTHWLDDKSRGNK